MNEMPGQAPQQRPDAAPAPQQSPEQAFQRGIELGKEYVQQASVKLAAWAEENPGQMLLVGLFAGFLVGKLFLSPRREAGSFDD